LEDEKVFVLFVVSELYVLLERQEYLPAESHLLVA
jgi:hypothetical protein